MEKGTERVGRWREREDYNPHLNKKDEESMSPKSS